MPKRPDLTGQRFGRWTVLERSPSNPKMAKRLARCDCGTETTLLQYDLTKGRSKSCLARINAYKPSAVMFKSVGPAAPVAVALAEPEPGDVDVVRACRVALAPAARLRIRRIRKPYDRRPGRSRP